MRDITKALRDALNAVQMAPDDAARNVAGDAYNTLVDSICPRCYGEGERVTGRRTVVPCKACDGTGEVPK
mgnify:FL=1